MPFDIDFKTKNSSQAKTYAAAILHTIQPSLKPLLWVFDSFVIELRPCKQSAMQSASLCIVDGIRTGLASERKAKAEPSKGWHTFKNSKAHAYQPEPL